MKIISFLLIAVVIIILLSKIEDLKDKKVGNTSSLEKIESVISKLPMYFEFNEGQANSEIKYISRGVGYTLFIKSTGFIASVKNGESFSDLNMDFEGANKNSNIYAIEKLPALTNYFTGSNPSNWKTGISNYSKLKVSEIYPGINLLYYGNNKELEYDFILNPNADASRIKANCIGVNSLETDEFGNLLLNMNKGLMKLEKPFAYQIINNAKSEIECNYQILAYNQFAFSLGDYDDDFPLIIDPVLNYSTFLGGNGDDIAYDIAVDNAGNAYVTGSTTSSDFYVSSTAFDTTGKKGGFFDPGDIFVTKLDSSGSFIIYSTYISGAGLDKGYGIAVDDSGYAVVVGTTESEDDTNTTAIDEGFPLMNPFQPNYGGNGDLFILKLNKTGSTLVYSSYLGGSENDRGNSQQDKPSVAVDQLGNAYIGGTTQSIDFPTLASPFMNSGPAPFVTKILPAGIMEYSITLGGDDFVFVQGIASDNFGNAYLIGFTGNPNLPTTGGSYQPIKNNGEDIFIYKIIPSGNGLQYCTYLGGNSDDFGYGITVDDTGNVYITGSSNSNDYPITSGFPVNGGTIITKLNSAGSSIIFSRALNGFTGKDIAVTKNGFTCITSEGSGGTSNRDVVFTVVDPEGLNIQFETYLGGLFNDIPNGIAVDNFGCAYITGNTYSDTFPGEEPTNPSPLQPNLSSPPDGFVLKYSFQDIITVGVETEKSSVLNKYVLSQNYPNPFNPTTKINFSMPSSVFTTLKVFDVIGNEIVTLINEEKEAGIYEINFDAANLPSGVYLYKLQAGSFVETKKMLLLK